MLERLQGLAVSLNAQLTAAKVVLLVAALALAVLLSRVLTGLAVLVLFVSLVVLAIRLLIRFFSSEQVLEGLGYRGAGLCRVDGGVNRVACAVYGPYRRGGCRLSPSEGVVANNPG
jgi:hypothetical protein